jgi:D-3-phosphoglycerate dehydrogenase
MSDTVDTLLRDMLAWLDRDARPYNEVMEAWRTSCPRLPVWEDATERGFVEQARADTGAVVRITPAGRAFLTGRM